MASHSKKDNAAALVAAYGAASTWFSNAAAEMVPMKYPSPRATQPGTSARAA